MRQLIDQAFSSFVDLMNDASAVITLLAATALGIVIGMFVTPMWFESAMRHPTVISMIGSMSVVAMMTLYGAVAMALYYHLLGLRNGKQ